MGKTTIGQCFIRSGSFVAFLLIMVPAAAQPDGTSHPGRQVYEERCAVCHDGGDPRALSLQSLQSMQADALLFALTEGLMAAQGQGLSEDQRHALIDYLANPEPLDTRWISNNLCSQESSGISFQQLALSSAGGNLHFSRNLSTAQSGLQRADMSNLELAWAIGFPNVQGLRSTPAITGDTVFYPAGATRQVLALDAGTGCVKWAYDAGATLRSSATLLELPAVDTGEGQWLVIVTDEMARVHAINARTGEQRWRVSGMVDAGTHTRLTGAPLAHDGRLYVPVSASGVQRGAEAEHECCDGRGAVLALDAGTGERIWTYVTLPEAQYTGERNSAGTRLRGPSGAPIWASPSLDERRGLLYVTTGENTSLPATGTSNAIIALDMDTGEQRWVFQAVADDVWNMACTGREYGPNCPSSEDSIRKDWDFGGAPVLVSSPGGQDILLAGQKSGHLWAVNPDDGSLLWQQRMGEGGALGGNHWGIATYDNRLVMLPISDPNAGGRPDDLVHAGIYAFDIATGEPRWEYRAQPDCTKGRELRVESCRQRYGFSALPIVVDGALVAGNIDGRLFIFDAQDGQLLYQFDTAQGFATVNGVEAEGGSIDSHSVSAGAGMIFVGSGYDRFRQEPGNVLLAFRPVAP